MRWLAAFIVALVIGGLSFQVWKLSREQPGTLVCLVYDANRLKALEVVVPSHDWECDDPSFHQPGTAMIKLPVKVYREGGIHAVLAHVPKGAGVP